MLIKWLDRGVMSQHSQLVLIESRLLTERRQCHSTLHPGGMLMLWIFWKQGTLLSQLVGNVARLDARFPFGPFKALSGSHLVSVARGSMGTRAMRGLFPFSAVLSCLVWLTIIVKRIN